MIYELATQAGALYWLLLFFGIFMVTVTANKCDDTMRPNIWAGLTAFFIFGFTDYRSDALEFFMGVIAYLCIGAGVAVMKWIDLVAQIKRFVGVVDNVTYSDLNTRNLTYKAFRPNNVTDELLTLPPDPHEFRSCITLWFMYWPSFTILKFIADWSAKLRVLVWKGFLKISRAFYDD